jgi:hypothetical protein
MINLDALEAKARAATPGPWYIGWISETNDDGEDDAEVESTSGGLVCTSHRRCNEPYLAAMSPDVALEMIAELKRLRGLERKPEHGMDCP